jgi:hypothetical protein
MFSTVHEENHGRSQGLSARGQPDQGPVQVVLGNRQIAAVAFVIVALMTLVAALAFLAGRAGPQTAAAKDGTLESTSGEQVIVVESADPKKDSRADSAAGTADKAKSAPEAPAASAPLPAPTAEPAQAAPAKSAPTPFDPDRSPRPKRGESYWQVASVDRGMAQVAVEYLARNGVPALLAEGTTPETFRVLAGPVANAEESARIKKSLDQMGFSPFVKNY